MKTPHYVSVRAAFAACLLLVTPVVGRANTANTVTVDASINQGAFPFHLGRNLCVIANTQVGGSNFGRLDLIGLDYVRGWFALSNAYDFTSKTANFEAYLPYFDAFLPRAGHALVSWNSNYEKLLEDLVTQTEFIAINRDALAFYKQHYPNLEFIECGNEPSSIAEYYPSYNLLFQAINAVNALGLPGPTLKIGGPVAAFLNKPTGPSDDYSTLIDQFLSAYASDATSGKRLDFVSYHQYLFRTTGGAGSYGDKSTPAMVADERALISGKLKHWLGLTQAAADAVPVIVSETGVFPGSRTGVLPGGTLPAAGHFAADLFIQAACLSSLHYYYAGQTNIVPLHWTIDHVDNDRKDMFVNGADGFPTPYFNSVLLQSMLPDTRISATSSTLDTNGIGVYGIAAYDSWPAAIMTWNYQWSRSATTTPASVVYDSTTNVSNLPTEFRTKNVHVERYRINSSFSNYLNPADRSKAFLALVESKVIAPLTSGSYSTGALPLEENALRFCMLTPTDLAVTAAVPAVPAAAIDYLADWSTTYYHTAGLVLYTPTSGELPKFGNDTNIVRRSSGTTQSLVYAIDPLYNVAVYAYSPTSTATVSLYTSFDKSHWTPLPATSAVTTNSGGWYRTIFTNTARLPSGDRYLKVEINGTDQYSPVLGRVEITNPTAAAYTDNLDDLTHTVANSTGWKIVNLAGETCFEGDTGGILRTQLAPVNIRWSNPSISTFSFRFYGATSSYNAANIKAYVSTNNENYAPVTLTAGTPVATGTTSSGFAIQRVDFSPSAALPAGTRYVLVELSGASPTSNYLTRFTVTP